MEELIKQAFLHVEVIGPHVHEGHYDLVGPDGEIILPQVWDIVVQPDWAITMHMWPMPEPPPPPPPLGQPDIQIMNPMAQPQIINMDPGVARSSAGSSSSRSSKKVATSPFMRWAAGGAAAKRAEAIKKAEKAKRAAAS